MTAAEVHAQSLAQLEALEPATFTWNGAEYPCLAGSVRRSRTLDPGGFSLDADLVLYVRHAVLGAGRPGPKEKLVHKTRTYRIETVTTPAQDQFLKFTCVDAARALGGG